VLFRSLPADVKAKVTTFLNELHGKDEQCAYNMAAGETSGFTPITHEAYESIIAVRLATQ
jgi:phosphonate transport system substrate-binding protein